MKWLVGLRRRIDRVTGMIAALMVLATQLGAMPVGASPVVVDGHLGRAYVVNAGPALVATAPGIGGATAARPCSRSHHAWNMDA